VDSLSFLLTAPYVPFASAILIMLGIGLLEIIGIGFSALDIDAHIDHAVDHDVDLDGGHNIDVLGWLGIGHVPLMAVMVSFLSLFGLAGMIEQNLAQQLFGHTLSMLLAVPGSLVVSLPLTGVSARVLGRIMPREETTIIGNHDLLGKRATILVGTATKGNPTKARITDYYGQTHYIMAEPDYDEVSEGDELILVRIEGNVFVGTSPYPSAMRPIS
jgi:membrane protein implicated in regulation of membrane protease activity